MAASSVSDWVRRNETLRSSHADSYGRVPQHTWFYRADYPNDACMHALNETVFRGFGEVEFHLHHGYDTPSGFGAKLDDGLDWFNSFGAMIGAQTKPSRRFAYIAGDWALDNGRGDPRFSGVDVEIRLLKAFGCYADFTFPAFGTSAQPRTVNSIYYATEDGRPKSYSVGVPAKKGRPPAGDLPLVQGPLFLDWLKGYVETAALELGTPYAPNRLRYWLDADVHVQGRPDCRIIKLHTHGMQSRQMILGPQMTQMFSDVEKWSADNGVRLHYVNAREVFNFVRAVEHGFDGDPHDVLDFEVAKPINRVLQCNVRYACTKCDSSGVALRLLESRPVRLEFAGGPIRSVVADDFHEIEIRHRAAESATLTISGSGTCDIEYGSADGSQRCTVVLPGTFTLPAS